MPPKSPGHDESIHGRRNIFPGCKPKIYERFHAKGRMLPDELMYLNSWLQDGPVLN